ncbi:MAG: hypothetical protein ACT6RF_19035, partial [Allorhizobium sp.]|uniref:hypothetical protein n=2 Tax=Allorhizobium sp. TaxID=633478 RepID=UPI0040343FEE
KREDGINERRSVMHETYVALAIASLQKEFGGRGRLSEDDFYARYSEAPWQRLARFGHSLLDRIRPRKLMEPTVTVDHHACHLAKA